MSSKKFYRTNAPAAYDYGYTTECGRRSEPDGYGRYREIRYVVIPDEHAVYQTDRYRSGLYYAVEVDQSEVAS